MKHICIWIGILFGSTFALRAQDDGLTILLQAIDSNNTTLKAVWAATEATKMANLTGLYPNNPQVQVNYLNISPLPNRTRTDVNITQTIDFPTAYTHRRRIAQTSNDKVGLELHSQRIVLRYEAAQSYVNWVYTQQVAKQYQRRAAIASQLAEAYQRAFEVGEVSVLERNKAKVNQLNITKAAELNEVEQAAWHAELVRMNGGQELPSIHVDYPDAGLPADFEAWYTGNAARNADIATLEQEISVSQERQRLSKALSFPAITAGYMYEEDVDVRFSGITMGVSIPLWQQKNTVKQARMQTYALEQAKVDLATQFHNEQRRLYERAKKLAAVNDELKSLTADSSGEQLLGRALELGELSLLDYLVELTMYYEAIDRQLEAERDLHLALVELYKWER